MLDVSFLTTLAAAVPTAEPGEDVIQWFIGSVQWIVEQFQARNYVPAIAAIVMVLTWATKKILGDRLKDDKLALLAAGFGMLVSAATELTTLAVGHGAFDAVRALVNGLLVGATASGFWSILGKKVFSKEAPATPAPAPAEEAKKEE